MKAFLQEYGTSLLCIIMVVMMIAISTPVGSSVSTALKGTVGDFSRLVNGDKSGDDGLMGKADGSMKEALGGGEESNKPVLTTGTLIKGTDFNAKLVNNQATEVIFTDEKTPDDAAIEDLTVEQDGSIVAWMDGDTYKVSSQKSGVEIKANKDCSGMFKQRTNMKTINLNNLNTSQTTNMKYMFRYCENLVSLSINNLNTQSVTDMNGMFACCYSISNLNLKNFNTSSVTDMGWMFDNCGITKLDVSSFDTSSVLNISFMFNHCSLLEKLDISNFNTSNVTNMDSAFSECYKLESLSLNNFSTLRVTNMTAMFYRCNDLKTIYVGNNWNILSVTNSFHMFTGSTSLIGQSGTTYDSSKIDKSMANWETGYLTLKTN